MPTFTPFKRKSFLLKAGAHRIALGEKTRIMGILNLTPDSFSLDGCLARGKNDPVRNAQRALTMILEGADIVDIGGESTRPGAKPISANEEIQRTIPTIKRLKKLTKTPISVDTYKPQVAQAALEAGASIVNDIRGTQPDRKLLRLVEGYKAAVVLMHIQGNSRTMQKNISYRNLMEEIISALEKSIEICLEIGIKSDRIIIDPGIGFGKTVEHNLEIIRRLKELSRLNFPILLGPSRKSFIGEVLKKDVGERLEGTVAAVCAGVMNTAHIVRIHDVAQIRDAVTMMDAILNDRPAYRRPAFEWDKTLT